MRVIDLFLFFDLSVLFSVLRQDAETHSDMWYNSVPYRPTELFLPPPSPQYFLSWKQSQTLICNLEYPLQGKFVKRTGDIPG